MKLNAQVIAAIALMVGCVVVGVIAAVEGRTSTVIIMALLLVANFLQIMAQIKLSKKQQAAAAQELHCEDTEK